MAKNSKETNGLREKSHKGVDNIIDKAESIEGSGKENIAQFKAKFSRMQKRVDNHIQNNPKRSVLIAAGAGMVVGVVLTAVLMRKRKVMNG